MRTCSKYSCTALLAAAAAASVMGQSAPPESEQIFTAADTNANESGPNVGSRPALRPPTATAPAHTASDAASVEVSRFHLTLGTDFTTAYYFRGLRQEDSGFIAQPYADALFDLFQSEAATLSLKLGTWHSVHAVATASSTDDSFTKYWYESDFYAGLGLVSGKWAFDARYFFYTSPSGAFGTAEEFDFSAEYDDSELLGAWSMSPAVTLAVETGSNAADGARRGTYLQIGVAPGFSFDLASIKSVAVAFPLSVGLSISNYYEGAGGENDAFGFASVGAKASVPLNLDKSWGIWTLSAGVQGLFLGDAASTFNNSDEFEVIGTVGVSVSF